MSRFDESWLRDYQRRQAERGGPTQKWPETAKKPDFEAEKQPKGHHYPDIVFRLSKPLLLPNRKKHLHWSEISAAIHLLSDEVSRGIENAPPEPLKMAAVTVLRYSLKEPDQDNLEASLKQLLDVLQPRSKRHPYGLGIITDDNHAHLESEIHHVQVKARAEQQTLVRIHDLGNQT
jgi:hypothetical protein